MKKKRPTRLAKKFHKWPGIIIAFFAIQFAISGIFMNHRELISHIDINRNMLPQKYSYRNWNLSAIKGGLPIGSDSMLIYGNIGTWLKVKNAFHNKNEGFDTGIDHRKTAKICQFRNKYVAGTQFGLYVNTKQLERWEKVPLPQMHQKIVDLLIKQDTLIILTRNQLIQTYDLQTFKTRQLPAKANDDKKVSMFKFLWELHSGELFGIFGKLFVDLIALITILLSLSGLAHFILPKQIKARKKKGKHTKKYISSFKTNLKWHNILGYGFILFLVINVGSGIFLRPPLLIPIASKQVKVIPGTHIDHKNPWHDKLRKAAWNDSVGKYIFSTSDGFFTCNEALNTPMAYMHKQPPVSVMGCNVLKEISPFTYLVGSFSGLYIWNITSGQVFDFFTQKPATKSKGMARPVSNHMVAGIINTESRSWYMDYNSGMIPINNTEIWDLPKQIKEASPISLWNLSLEIHTGRIFEAFLGIFYILYVPFAGLCMLTVLISGFLIWVKSLKRKRHT